MSEDIDPLDPPDEQFRAERWVRIFTDVYCEGLWDKRGHSRDVVDLPVSQGLRDRLLAWQVVSDDWEYVYSEWVERNYGCGGPDRPDLKQAEPMPFFDWDAFSAEGWAIARAVKAELPDWTVIFYDEVVHTRALAETNSYKTGRSPDYIIQPDPLPPLRYYDELYTERLSPEQIGNCGTDKISDAEKRALMEAAGLKWSGYPWPP